MYILALRKPVFAANCSEGPLSARIAKKTRKTSVVPTDLFPGANSLANLNQLYLVLAGFANPDQLMQPQIQVFKNIFA